MTDFIAYIGVKGKLFHFLIYISSMKSQKTADASILVIVRIQIIKVTNLLGMSLLGKFCALLLCQFDEKNSLPIEESV